jgi:hypothetical protein
MSTRDKTLQVEALTYSDTFDATAQKYFRGRAIHRAEDTGAYDIRKMVEKFGDRLDRSRQEFSASPSGLTSHLEWASLCFQLEDGVFLTVLAKGSSQVRARTSEDESSVAVIAGTPQKAASVLAELRKEFLKKSNDEGPAFFIMTDNRRTQRAPLESSHHLDSSLLSLHYGEDFPQWADEFLANLRDPGISILRGEAGTGKTSFLRHAMYSLAKTHRFYFVPVDNFGLLSSGSLTEFWKMEQRDYPSASKVLVLEDSETLLSDRNHQKNSPVSALLNLTDGLMTQFIKLHLICTLNCKIDDVDSALLRPGRLRFFKTFDRIPRQRALKLAKHYGLTLSNQADFTLADIFASPNFSTNTSGAVKGKGPVGFGN